MEIGIISDIHGDFARLDKAYQQLDPRTVYALGDIIHWGVHFDENRCVDLVRNSESRAVRGNHEDTALEIMAAQRERAGTSEMEAKIWPQNIEYLRALPQLITEGDLLFAHNIPPDSFVRVESMDLAKEAFKYMEVQHPGTRVAIIGHYHEPVCFWHDPRKDRYGEIRAETITIRPGIRYIVTPGSLAKREPGSFAILDIDRRVIQRRQIR